MFYFLSLSLPSSVFAFGKWERTVARHLFDINTPKQDVAAAEELGNNELGPINGA